jgi:hypothetical protein
MLDFRYLGHVAHGIGVDLRRIDLNSDDGKAGLLWCLFTFINWPMSHVMLARK